MANSLALNRSWASGLFAVALLLLSTGCFRTITSTPGEAPNLEKWVAEVKAKPAPPLDPLPVMQQFETFEYTAQDMRDPFSTAFTDQDNGSGPRPEKERRKQPLEQFPLDGLDMVGTLGRGSGIVALVMAPDKVTYRVRPGAYMGQNDGRVTSVSEERIDLVELVPDGAGGWLERPASVALEDQ
ncbi:pilus assembly protein PilP [Lysobacter sp. Root690]|uniref:pilus assembly protein PilP n=1 Tax=Lysobacter sp. Root690 TaxID=1736588 RepID=UPI000700D5AC|nr:pilus assembly protein PilP [Lysobacter sp. Root690]KRB10214.1 fimbrial protein [Lysobacter sp. Root690]